MSQDATPTPAATAPAAGKPSFKDRLVTLVQAYGTLAVLVYLGLFLLSVAAFSVAIQVGLRDVVERLGVSLEGAGGLGGTLLVAWAATKAIQVPRILATLALTPAVARLPWVARWLARRQP